MDEFFTTVEAAKFIKRTPAAVRQLVTRQQIPFRKPGGRLMFIKEELIKWIESADGVRIDEVNKYK